MNLRRVLVGLLTAAAALACLGAGPAGALAATTTSSNWAGYVVSRSGGRSRHGVASWVQSAAPCTSGARAYSAAWVGLGGYHTSSQALQPDRHPGHLPGDGPARSRAR